MNLKPWKQPNISPKPVTILSLGLHSALVPVINCLKKFTFSLPPEPSKHKLALYKSVRATELSIYRVLIYTFQMGDYRTVVRHWSIKHTSSSTHSPASLWWGSLLSWWPNVWVLQTNKQKHERHLKFLEGGMEQTMKHFLCYLGHTLYLVVRCVREEQFQHANQCLTLWIYEDSQLIQHNKTLFIMQSETFHLLGELA